MTECRGDFQVKVFYPGRNACTWRLVIEKFRFQVLIVTCYLKEPTEMILEIRIRNKMFPALEIYARGGYFPCPTGYTLLHVCQT